MTETGQSELKRVIKEEEKTAKHEREQPALEKKTLDKNVEAASEPAKEPQKTAKAKKPAKEEEKPSEEKIFVVSLAKVRKAPRNVRASDAAKRLRNALTRSFHRPAVLSMDVNARLWSRGIQKPPRSVRVKASVFKDRVEVGLAK
ncbi:hypothetical protein HY546_02475 [archaeon]|nr:hypothetical protein [archaeon]